MAVGKHAVGSLEKRVSALRRDLELSNIVSSSYQMQMSKQATIGGTTPTSSGRRYQQSPGKQRTSLMNMMNEAIVDTNLHTNTNKNKVKHNANTNNKLATKYSSSNIKTAANFDAVSSGSIPYDVESGGEGDDAPSTEDDMEEINPKYKLKQQQMEQQRNRQRSELSSSDSRGSSILFSPN